MPENKLYLIILKEDTQKRLDILGQILEMTYLLEETICKSPYSYDLINDLLFKKNILLKELVRLDIDFENTYQHVQSSIKEINDKYNNEIKIIQDLIKQLMETSIRLRIIETKVKQEFDELRKKQKSDIQKYNVNKRITNNYNPYQNTNNVESIFFDKKK